MKLEGVRFAGDGNDGQANKKKRKRTGKSTVTGDCDEEEEDDDTASNSFGGVMDDAFNLEEISDERLESLFESTAGFPSVSLKIHKPFQTDDFVACLIPLILTIMIINVLMMRVKEENIRH